MDKKGEHWIWIGKTAVIFAVLYIITGGFLLFFSYIGLDRLAGYLTCIPEFIGVFLMAYFFIGERDVKKSFEVLGIKKDGLLRGIIIGLCSIIVLGGLGILGYSLFGGGINPSSFYFLADIDKGTFSPFSIALIPALFSFFIFALYEEMAFRGLLMTAITGNNKKPKLRVIIFAIIVCSILFAFWHYPQDGFNHFEDRVFWGLIFGAVYFASKRNVIGSTLVHWISNSWKPVNLFAFSNILGVIFSH